MRILGAITEPAVAQRILACMGLPPRAPPVVPAASTEPGADSWLDGPEATGFEDFDQRPPSDWDLGA